MVSLYPMGRKEVTSPSERPRDGSRKVARASREDAPPLSVSYNDRGFAYNALRSVCLSGGAPERLGGADGYEHGFGALRHCDASIGEGKSAKFGREEAYSSAQSILISPYKARSVAPSQPIRPCHRSKTIATCPSRRAPGTSQRALYHALQSSGFPKAAVLFGLSRQHRRTCEPP